MTPPLQGPHSYVPTFEQIDDYKQNGYIVVEQLFSDTECDHLLAVMKQHANQDYAAIMNPDRPEFLLAQTKIPQEDKAPLHKRALTIEHAIQTAEFMRRVMTDPRAISIMEMAMEREVVGLMSQMLFKEAQSPYASQAWNPHQDNSYVQNPNAQYITTNLFLADANKKNGCMYMYPGSHTRGLLPAEDVKSYREKQGTNPGKTCEIPTDLKSKKTDLITKKGDLLVMNGNTIHGSYPNTSKTKSRPLYSASYITRGETFLRGVTSQKRIIPVR